MTSINFRQATVGDAEAIHRLICENLEAGHLLPRTLDDVATNAVRFIVAEGDERVIACAELAPLSRGVAEVRSLVVDAPARGHRIGSRLIAALGTRATGRGFATLCAFTHDPSHFVRLGFTIVPHMWVPDKVEHDCRACPLFRRCGQYAVTLPLRAGVSIRPEQPALVIHGERRIPARRRAVERLHLHDTGNVAADEAVPA